MNKIDKKKLDNKKYYRKLKETIIAHYSKGSMRCKKCGELRLYALQIDHINNNGAVHRRQVVHGHIYEWLIRNNFPKGYQVLCANCNWMKRNKVCCKYRKKTGNKTDQAYYRKKRKELRFKIIKHYSKGKMCCAQCGEKKICVLHLDLIKGRGLQYRLKMGCDSSISFFRWIVKNNFPSGFQILCVNCNLVKRYEENECCLSDDDE